MLLQYRYIEEKDDIKAADFIPLIEPLDCLHKGDIVHGDIRQCNLLFSKDGDAKIIELILLLQMVLNMSVDTIMLISWSVIVVHQRGHQWRKLMIVMPWLWFSNHLTEIIVQLIRSRTKPVHYQI